MSDTVLPMLWVFLSLLVLIFLSATVGWTGFIVGVVFGFFSAAMCATIDRNLTERAVREFNAAFPPHSDARAIAVEMLETIAKRTGKSFARGVLRRIQPMISTSPEPQIQSALHRKEESPPPKPEKPRPMALRRSIPLDLECDMMPERAAPSAPKRYIPLDPEDSPQAEDEG